jgi:MarR family transcriptional regulator, lower aerobic nicotinate degradation pathway regulator
MTTTTEIQSQPIPSRLAKELVKSSGFLLARLGLGFKSKAITALDDAGFETYDYGVLAMLAEGARLTQANIADALALDPSRLVALLDSLEDRGLIMRQRDPEDRRRHVVSITTKGERELAQLREIVGELEEAFLSPLDAKDRKTLHELLQRLACAHDPRCAFGPDQPS